MQIRLAATNGNNPWEGGIGPAGSPLLGGADLDWSKAERVLNRGYKYLIPLTAVSLDEAQPAVHPTALPNGSPNPKGGEPITDWSGKPIGQFCILIPNTTDNTWQAAPVDALLGLKQGDPLPSNAPVLIVNDINDAKAATITAILSGYAGGPANLSAADVIDAVQRIRQEVTGDIYDSDRGYVGSMKPLQGQTALCSGHVQQDVPMDAVFLPGPIQFQGPSATPQQGPDGLVIVKKPNDKPEKARGIQPDVFEKTYKNKEGNDITVADLPLALG